MKIKEIGSKLGKRIGPWRIGDYIRQFSIVVAGIVVTFAGSSAIGNYEKQQEVKSVMQLVCSELQSNKKELSRITRELDNERKFALMLMESDYEYDKIPEDTLRVYQRLFFRLSSLKYSRDALEVLKNSSLMQQISDKNFLLSIIQSYEVLREIEKDVAYYYTMKRENIIPALSLINDEDRKLMRDGDLNVSYRIYLSTLVTRNSISNIPSFFDSETFSHADRKLQQSINDIKGRYK